MKKICLAILLAVGFQLINAHPWKPAHLVLIDTDAGLDDMRAISMLLASDDVKVLGIIVSGGALSPYDGYKKIKSMLNFYHHDGIPVAMNYNIRGHDMPVPLALNWGVENNLTVPETNGFNKLCKTLCKSGNDKISFISLGSLNSIAELVNGGVLAEERIKEIIWSNNSLARLSGFNASIDIRSANRVIKGDIPLITIGYPTGSFYDSNYVAELQNVNNRYSNKLAEVIRSNPDLSNHNFALTAADEMVAIYLNNPELFTGEAVKNNRFMKPGKLEDLRKSAIMTLKGGGKQGMQIIKVLPADSSFYQPDIQPFINDIISIHGKEEWVSGVLTNEIHGHFGIYSIIGVKMGILAREYFGAGVDDFEIISRAGTTPPLSCMNDGLQVSTGATIGHGLIEVDSSSPSPSAEFKHYGYRIKIRLKNDIASTIAEELKELSLVNGLDSDIYWELVRQRAILHWKNLNKYDIFEIEVMD